MIPRNRLLRVVALPAFEGLPAQVVFIRKYGERWYVRVSLASEKRLAGIVREWPDVEVDSDELGVAVTLFVDPEQKALARMGEQTTMPALALDVRAKRN